MKLLDEFRDRGKPRNNYDSMNYREGKPSIQDSHYRAISSQSNTSRSQLSNLASPQRESAILVEDNSHFLTERFGYSQRGPYRQFDTARDPRSGFESQPRHQIEENDGAALRRARAEEPLIQRRVARDGFDKENCSTRKFSRESSYENQINKENVDANRMIPRDDFSTAKKSTPCDVKLSHSIERKTLQNLNPNEYYNRVISSVHEEERQYLRDTSRSEISNYSQRVSSVEARPSPSSHQDKTTLNFKQKLSNYLAKEEESSNEAYGRVSHNSKELDNLYMNYINKRVTKSPRQSRLTVPSIKAYEERLAQKGKTHQSPSRNASITSPKTALRSSSKKKRDSHNRSVRFSIGQEQPSRRSATQESVRLSSPSSGRVLEERNFSTVEKVVQMQQSSMNKQLPSPRRSQSAASRASYDLGATMPARLSGDRNQYVATAESEYMLNKSASLSSIRASSVSRPSHLGGFGDESCISIRSQESARSQKARAIHSDRFPKYIYSLGLST